MNIAWSCTVYSPFASTGHHFSIAIHIMFVCNNCKKVLINYS